MVPFWYVTHKVVKATHSQSGVYVMCLYDNMRTLLLRVCFLVLVMLCLSVLLELVARID